MHAYGTPDLLAGPAALSPPLDRASTWPSADAETIRALGTRVAHGPFYARYGHPVGRLFEARVAALEGAEGAVAFASGMAAVHGTLAALCSRGDRVLIAEQIYGGTDALARLDLPRFGLEVERFDACDPEALGRALGRGARLVLVETPINPTLRLVDLRAVAAACRAAGAVSVVDGTFAPPPIQRGLDCGIDLVLHSATKFLGGHSDLLAGVVAGRHEHLEPIEAFRARTGGVLAPDPAWLLCRSLQTHAVRIAAQQAAAAAVAADLLRHAGPGRPIAAVHYPGAAHHPDAALAARQMTGGGCLVTFDVDGGLPVAMAMFDAFELVARAPSLGGVETLASLPAHTTHARLAPEERRRIGIDDGAVRLSIGLEGAERILADVLQAIERARRTVDAR